MGVPQPAHLQPTPLQASSGSAAFLMCQSQRVGQELGPLFAPLLPALAFLGGISLHSRPSWKVSAQTRCLHFLLVPACLDHPVTKVYSLALHCKQIKDGKCVTINWRKWKWTTEVGSCTWMVILPSASNPITLRCCCPLTTAASRPRVSRTDEGKILRGNILCASRGATGCLRIRHHPLPPAQLVTTTATAALHCALYHCIIS